MGKIFAITSGKGGTGKSTVSAGLALAFAANGKRVLLIDLDEGLRCLDLMLGIDEELVFDLSDLLDGRELADAAYSVPGTDRLQLIPAPRQIGKIDSAAFSSFLERTVPDFDIILLDFPAGIDFRLYSALPAQVHFIAVCSPDPISVRDAAVVCDNLPPVNVPPVLILNKFVYEMMRNGIYRNIDEIIDASGFRLLGIVPQDSELLFLAVKHKLKHNGRSMKAFCRIAMRLDGEQVRLPDPKKI